ncbi:MAG: PAS domain S-box protein [Armatimonadota bacterium]
MGEPARKREWHRPSEEAAYELAAIVESSDDAIIGKTLEGIITSWNPAAERLYGYTANEVIGKPINMLVPPGHTDEIPNILKEIMRGKRVEHYEAVRRRKDGRLVDVSLTVSPINDAAGNIVGASTIARDITERKKAGEAAYELAAIVASSDDAIIGKTLEGVITSWNPAAERLYGYAADEVIGKPIQILVPPGHPDEIPRILEEMRRGERIEHYEALRRSKDGRLIDVSLTVSPIKDASGTIIGASTIARDITEQKKAEELTRAASLYARSLIEASLDPLVTIGPDGKITDVNKATEEATGVPRERLIGTDFADYFTDPNKAREGYKLVFSQGFVRDYPLAIRHVSGRVMDVLYNATVYRDENDNVQGVFAAARDITERKKAEEATYELAAIIESTDDAIIGKTLDGMITSWNPAAVRFYGYAADEVIGRSIEILVPPGHPEEIPRILSTIRRGESVEHYDSVRQRKDGRLIDVSLTVSPIKDAQGTIIGASTIARDITERKKAEEKIRAASLYARSLIEASLDPLVTIGPDGKITDVNKATEDVTGVPRERLIGTDFADYFIEPDQAREGYTLAFSQGFVRDYPLALRHIDGHVTDVLYNATVYRDAAGNIQGVFAAARDITERKKAEEQLRTASLYARSLIEASLDPLVTIGPDGKITDVNLATEEVTGVGRDGLIGTDFADYFTEPDQAREGYQLVFSKGLVRDYPLAIRHASGRVTDVLYNATVYLDEAGNVTGVFAAARDITERKIAEEQLKAASLYARTLIEASLDPLVTIGPDGKITDVNKATEEVTGVSRDRLIGTDFADYFTEPDQAREGYTLTFSQGFVRDYPLAIHHLTGRITDVLYNATVFRDEEGHVQGVFAAARDITERKKAEEKIRAASLYARTLIEASIDPLVTIGPDGSITDVNRATEEVTGVARDRLIGTDFADYFTEPEKAREGYQLVFSEGLVRDYPLAIRHVSGHITDVLYNATVYRDEVDNVAGVFAAARDITERKKAEEQLRSASLYARSLIEASIDPLVTIGPDGKVTDVNRATEEATGVSRVQLIGTDFADYFTEPDKAREGYQLAFSEGLVRDYPLAIRHLTGNIIDVLYNATVYRNEAGNVAGVFAAARDITERKKAEEQLKAASQYARTLIEASLDPLVTIGPDGKITDVNKATEDVTGVPRDRLIGTDFADYFTEPDKAREGYQLVFSKGLVRDYPLAIRHTTGRITDVLYNATVYRNEAGDVAGVFAAARDITERKIAEEQLKAASLYSRSLIEASLDPLVTIGPDGKITDVNKATEEATGIPRARLIGTDFADYFTEPEEAREGYKKVFSEGYVLDYPLALRHRSGRVTDVLYNASTFRDEDGNVTGVFAAARDITERKKAEEQLRSASQYARTLIEASLDPLVTIGPDGTITDVNLATEEVTGVARDGLIGTDFADYFTEPQKAREGYQLAFSRGLVRDYPLAIRHTSGRITDVLYNATVFKDEGGNVTGVFAAARDITERKKAEEAVEKLNEDLRHRTVELEASNREMEAFTYSVSHDLRAPLRSIDGFSQSLLMEYVDTLDEEGKDSLHRVRAAAQRMGQLIDDLLRMSRVTRAEMTREQIDLTAMATDIAENLRETQPEREVEFVIAPDVRSYGDPNLLRIVLDNLLGNSWKFTSTRPVGRIEFGMRYENGESVYFVRDNGVGFDMEYGEKLFVPFQRLHAITEFPGTGIGLALVKRIIERHGGRVWAEGEIDRGATFYFTL